MGHHLPQHEAAKPGSHFGCTQCGKCCHGLKVPLTVSEAVAWLRDGNAAQIICEAVPWPAEPAADDLPAAYKRRRSFAAMSGSLPTRVVVMLVASFPGACPNLQADMRCGIYARRPLVCRIYPAEINPFVEMAIAGKPCPPEAWAVNQPPGKTPILVDAHMQSLIQQFRDADVRDVRVKERLCASLQLDAAALANEGFVIYSPDRSVLLGELQSALHNSALRDSTLQDSNEGRTPWRYVSNQRLSVDALSSLGATALLANGQDKLPFEYMGFKPAAPAPGGEASSSHAQSPRRDRILRLGAQGWTRATWLLKAPRRPALSSTKSVPPSKVAATGSR
jgi:Fe-S-cluster containining protein